jgi:hypothetical protein
MNGVILLNDLKVLLNKNDFNKNHILNNLKNIHLLSDKTYLKAKVLTLKPIYTQLQDVLIKLNILNKEAVSVILSYIVFLLLLIVPEEEIDKLSTILKKIIHDFMNEQSGGIKITDENGEEVNIKIPEEFNWMKHIKTLNITFIILTIIILILFFIANVFSLRDLLFDIVPIAPNANNGAQMANNTFALVTLPYNNNALALSQPDASKFVKEHVLGNQLLTSGVIATINEIMIKCVGCDKTRSDLIIVQLQKLQNTMITFYNNTFTETAAIVDYVIKQSVDAVVILVLKTVFRIDKIKPKFVLQTLLTDEANQQLQHMLKHTKLDIEQISEKYLSEYYKKIITLLEKKKNEGLLEKMVTAASAVLRVTDIDVLKNDIMNALKIAFKHLKTLSGYNQVKIGAEQIKIESDLIIKNYINDVSNKVKILYMLLGMLATSSGYLLWELKYIYNTREYFKEKIAKYVKAYKEDYSQRQNEAQYDNEIFRDSEYDDDDKEQRATRSKGTRKGSKSKGSNQGSNNQIKYSNEVDDEIPQPQGTIDQLTYNPTGANVSNVIPKSKIPTRKTRSNKQEETGIKQLTYIPKGGNKKSRKNKTKKNKRKNRKNKTYKK